METATGQLTVLLTKSITMWDLFWHGHYKDAVVIWEISNLAGRNTAVVFRYHKTAGWVIGPSVQKFKKNAPHAKVTLQYFNSPEYHTDKFIEMLGSTHFDGERLTPAKGIARLIGMANWKKATWSSLVADAKHTI